MVRPSPAILLGLLVVSQSLAAPVVAVSPSERTDDPANPALGGDVAGAAAATTTNESAAVQPNTVVERRVFDRTPPQPGEVRLTYRYQLPDSVVSLETSVPGLRRDAASVVATDGFTRTDGGAYEWDTDTETPSLTVGLSVPETRLNEVGVERPSFAFAFYPDTQTSWRYRSSGGSGPTYQVRSSVDGPGVAVDSMGYAGPGQVISGTTVQGTNVAVAVAEGANASADPEQLATVARILVEDFRLGRQYDDTGVFVLPDDATPGSVTGQNLDDSYWVQGSSARLDTVETTLTHEFAHTRIGQFDGESGRWLTEGAAEYYGYVLALNQGSGDFAELTSLFEAYADRYAPGEQPAVLTDPDSWDGTLADYQKGALVLAALDARIRESTDGEYRLRDVLATRFEESSDYGQLESYDDLRRAVVEVTGQSQLGPWLDRYATTDAVPLVPDDPYHFVTRWGADPDRDTLTSRREREAGTNPFETDTDGDGIRDFVELREGLNASAPDTDEDGLADDTELSGPTDPTDPDTDDDGAPDSEDAYPTDQSLTSPTPTATAVPTTTPEPMANLTADVSTVTSTTAERDPGDGTTDVSGPGFSGLAAAIAVLACVLWLARHRH